MSMARLNGEMLRFHPIFLPHSTHRRGSVGFRADVGIGPYIPVGVRTVPQCFTASCSMFRPFFHWSQYTRVHFLYWANFRRAACSSP